MKFNTRKYRLLWFGISHEYWESAGSPLCSEVQDRQWDNCICTEFIKNHPQNVRSPINDYKP